MGPHYQNLTSPSTQTMGLPLPHFSVETRSYDAVLRGCNIARLAQILVFLRQNLVFQVCGELHMGPTHLSFIFVSGFLSWLWGVCVVCCVQCTPLSPLKFGCVVAYLISVQKRKWWWWWGRWFQRLAGQQQHSNQASFTACELRMGRATVSNLRHYY